jgi:poly(hydroxyalkanoate) depolymerase family esterase
VFNVAAILKKQGIHLPNLTGHSSPLEEIVDFGANPGNLRMFRYVPAAIAPDPALLVVLHGCTQTAAGYDIGAGWSALADRFGFVLLFPEQQRVNNPNGCFNWFQPLDVRRGQGEAGSIRQMIERCQSDLALDPRRIFITGLSAGGAMTSAMLACYPEVFAGGAIIAGLPFGAAADVRQAFESMSRSPSRPAKDWGDLVRRASAHQGPWPRISVWHGAADTTVVPANAHEIVEQWKDVHGIAAPAVNDVVDGITRSVWKNGAGDDVIESYIVPRMAHGTPLATGQGETGYGAAGPFMLEAGISSSYHIAKFFGLVDPSAQRVAPERVQSSNGSGKSSPFPKETVAAKGGRINIGEVIANALKAAGLR